MCDDRLGWQRLSPQSPSDVIMAVRFASRCDTGSEGGGFVNTSSLSLGRGLG